MKKIFLVTFMGFSIATQAQTSMKINLQQAMNIGLKNRYDLKADQYKVNLAKNTVNKDKKAWIPNIHAEGNVQYNTRIRATPIPSGFPGFPDGGTIALGAKNVSTFGLALNQPIFKPGINANVKLSKANLSLQKEKIHGNKITIKNSIATAYLNVLLKKLQLKIAQNEEQRFQTYEQLAKGKYDNGALIKNDYLRAKLDYENAKVKTKTTKQNYDLAVQFLKYQMNVPNGTTIILTDSIGNISFSSLNQTALQPLKNRTEIKQLELKQKMAGLNIKKVKQNALPSVALVGYYAQLYQNQNFHYDESKWWAPVSYVGLQINIPITGNLSNQNNIRQYKLQQQQLVFQLKQEKATVTYQVQRARTDLLNATKNMQSAKANYALSKTIYKNQQQQFAIGVFHYTDLLNTEKSLNKAEQNYIQTVYAYMKSKIAYREAVGEW